MQKTLDQIYKVATRFLTPLSLKDTYEAIVSEAEKFARADFGSIFIRKDGQLVRISSTAPQNLKIEPRESGFSYQALEGNKPFILSQMLLKKVHPEADPKIKTIVLVPLSYMDKSIGVLSLIFANHKFLEKKLHTLTLFGSLASLAIKKAQLYSRTKKALEARDLFISTAAHELKTPLTTISVYNELIFNCVMGGALPKKKWVEGLSSQIYRLTKLINEFLQLDKLKISDLRYEWSKVSLQNVIGQSIKNFHIKYPGREIIFEEELNGTRDTIKGDFDKLLQVVNNLLDNALKFSPKRSTISVLLSRKTPYFSIRVNDKGKGISEKSLSNVFRKYYKGEVHSKPGMGIGLYLSKKIIDRHRGVINIESKQKKGTTVEVLLPRK